MVGCPQGREGRALEPRQRWGHSKRPSGSQPQTHSRREVWGKLLCLFLLFFSKRPCPPPAYPSGQQLALEHLRRYTLQSTLPRPVVNFSGAACLANGLGSQLSLHPCLSAQASPTPALLGQKAQCCPAARPATPPPAPVCALPRTRASAVGLAYL